MRRTLSVLAVTLMLGSFVRPVAADPLRCGSVLIDVGAQASDVLARCGEPASKTTVTEPVQARNAGGHVSQTGTTQAEVWRYRRGQHSVEIKIADGVVQSVETAD